MLDLRRPIQTIYNDLAGGYAQPQLTSQPKPLYDVLAEQMLRCIYMQACFFRNKKLMNLCEAELGIAKLPKPEATITHQPECAP